MKPLVLLLASLAAFLPIRAQETIFRASASCGPVLDYSGRPPSEPVGLFCPVECLLSNGRFVWDMYECQVFPQGRTEAQLQRVCARKAETDPDFSCPPPLPPFPPCQPDDLPPCPPIGPPIVPGPPLAQATLQMVVPTGFLSKARPKENCRVAEWTDACAWISEARGNFGETRGCVPQGAGRVTVGVVFDCR